MSHWRAFKHCVVAALPAIIPLFPSLIITMSSPWPSIIALLAWLAADSSMIAQTHAFSHTLLARRTIPTLAPLSYRAQDEDAPALYKEEEQEEEENQSFSKSKWKKKRYVMMKDVDDAIAQDPTRAVKKAQEMIRRMTRLHKITSVDDYKPTAQAYNLLINAFAKSGLSDAGYEAERVMQEMIAAGVKPNAISFTSTLDAYAKSGEKDSAQQAERVLLELLDLNVDLHISSVDAVLNAYALQSSLESAERAQSILERLEMLQSDTIQPTVHSYSTVMNAFAKCGAAERAHAILTKVLKENKAIRPDTVMFNVVIHAWSTSGDAQAGTKAVELLNQMKQLASEGYDTAPDIVTYNSVLSCWSKSGHIHAGPQAERILKQLQEDDSNVKPNVVSYNSVLHAWSKNAGLDSGAAERAQAVLDYMIQSGDDDIAPDVYSFTSVLNAWAKSKEDDKAIRARELLDTLLELHADSPRRKDLRPSAIPFNAVLNACAFSQSMKREALQIAVTTFKELPQYDKRDTISYGNLLKCCTNLMPQSKAGIDMALQIFDSCCKDGLVGDLVWNEVRKVVPSRDLARKLPPQRKQRSIGIMSLRDLPRSWKRNTRDKQAAAAKHHTRRRHRKQEDDSSLPPQTIRPMRNIVEKSYESGRDL